MTEIKMGKLRSMFFPIYTHEFKKLLPLTVMFLFVSFNYALLRGLKDVYVYNMMSKESIYPLKVLVIPSIIFFTIIYTFIAKRVNRDVRFNIVVSYFLFFFFISTFLLGNNSVHLNRIAEICNNYIQYPALWNCLRVWPEALFYIHAEAWGTIVLGVSFWTFANEIVSSIQAKRVYPFLTIGAALGAICSGVFLFFSTKIKIEYIQFGNYIIKFENLQVLVVICLICFILLIYNVLTFNINKNPEEYEIEKKIKKNKVKLSFVQSISFLLKSKYLLFVTCMVFGYNMFIVFLESVWKGCVGGYEAYLVKSFTGGDISLLSAGKAFAKSRIMEIYGIQSIVVGILSLFWIFFIARTVSAKKWLQVALFTPVMSFVSTCIFIILFGYKNHLTLFTNFFNCNSLLILVYFGLIIICLIKSSKYVFFDTSKERTYIPLDEESKVNGKAAIDAIGSRLAKGGSSICISVLLYFFGCLENIAYISFFFVFVLIFLWIFAVYKLNPLYEQKLKEQKNNDI